MQLETRGTTGVVTVNYTVSPVILSSLCNNKTTHSWSSNLTDSNNIYYISIMYTFPGLLNCKSEKLCHFVCWTGILLSVFRLQREDKGLPTFSSKTSNIQEGFSLQFWWLSHEPLHQQNKIYSLYERSIWLSL